MSPSEEQNESELLNIITEEDDNRDVSNDAKCNHQDDRVCYTDLENTVKNVPQDVNKESPTASTTDVDSIHSGESLFKTFHFETQEDDPEIVKCVSFWKTVLAKNIKPMKCTLLKHKERQGKKEKREKMNVKKEEPCEKYETKQLWMNVYKELQKKKLDEIKLVHKRKCDPCEEYIDEESEKRQDSQDIRKLNEWKSQRHQTTRIDVKSQVKRTLEVLKSTKSAPKPKHTFSKENQSKNEPDLKSLPKIKTSVSMHLESPQTDPNFLAQISENEVYHSETGENSEQVTKALHLQGNEGEIGDQRKNQLSSTKVTHQNSQQSTNLKNPQLSRSKLEQDSRRKTSNSRRLIESTVQNTDIHNSQSKTRSIERNSPQSSQLKIEQPKRNSDNVSGNIVTTQLSQTQNANRSLSRSKIPQSKTKVPYSEQSIRSLKKLSTGLALSESQKMQSSFQQSVHFRSSSKNQENRMSASGEGSKVELDKTETKEISSRDIKKPSDFQLSGDTIAEKTQKSIDGLSYDSHSKTKLQKQATQLYEGNVCDKCGCDIEHCVCGEFADLQTPLESGKFETCSLCACENICICGKNLQEKNTCSCDCQLPECICEKLDHCECSCGLSDCICEEINDCVCDCGVEDCICKQLYRESDFVDVISTYLETLDLPKQVSSRSDPPKGISVEVQTADEVRERAPIRKGSYCIICGHFDCNCIG